MENKNLIIVAVAIVVIIAIVGVIFATGILNNQSQVTSPFKTDFMEGNFVGNVSLENDTQKFMHSYKDKQHDITYNISTVDNSTALMEIYELQGVTNPEHRNFNGNDWNIYFTQAVPGDNASSSANNTMNIVICESQGQKQGYLIYAIFGAKSDVNSTGNVFGDTYKVYVEPLLKSITLKQSSDVPAIYDEFGLTEEQFAQQMELVHQYKAGNVSALEG
ncbi:MAG: hypothetical protein IJL02_08770 [Methanobrevibacter sp.]|uniref:hypothetical protein n=1 Tax=Methanobrevibacter sp. TaxID=66852 RepID=UPI0025D1CD57|nr:hypothetical protein [Methanobrevibacter sp.]MBQ6099930.1 hypothetical protein [Methanobrevibacter sp.]